MRRVAMAMYFVGGAACLSGVWITQSSDQSRLVQGVVSALVIGIGILVAMVQPPRRWFLEISVVWSVALLSVLIGFSDPLGMAPFFYLWPVVYAAYFCSTRLVVLSYATMVTTLIPALVLNDAVELKLDTFVGTTATVGLMAALVAGMTKQEKRLRGELAKAAETDPLTGLLNRRSFDPRFESRLIEARAQRRPLSLVMLDLDHFKLLNDEYGHMVGDDALRRVAEILVEVSRDQDLVSRFGGEEFAVALPGADLAAASRYAERVADAMTEPLASGATISVSAGISTFVGTESADLLLQRADQALYAAKAGGRCRSATWDDGITVAPRFGGTPSPDRAA